MKLLLTNDDGFEAEGLQELAKLLCREHEVFVVAPDSGRSCCGHSVTNAEDLHVVKQSESAWTVSGTPADCVRMAICVLQLKPDWVLSGVNHGGNLGIDTIYSGTVAGAREAASLGYSSVALSQYMRRDIAMDWGQTARFASRVLDHVWAQELATDSFWNVNLPALAPNDSLERNGHLFPITHCSLEKAPLKISYELLQNASDQLQRSTHRYQSNYQLRPRDPGSDVHYCFSGHATITRLGVFGEIPEIQQ